MKKLLALVLAASMLAFTACSSSEPATSTPNDDSDTTTTEGTGTDISMWRIGTASMTGNFYTMGSAIAQMVNDKLEGVEAAAQATGGSADNCFLLLDQEVDLALSQSASVKEAVEGTGAFEGNPIEMMRGVGVLYIMEFHVVVNNNSDVDTIADIAGKKVAVGSMGGGVEVNANILLEEFGVTEYDRIYGTMGEAIDAVKNGEADVLIYATSKGAANISDALNSGNCKLIGMSEEDAKRITDERSEFGIAVIPAETYQNQPEDVHTIAGSALLLTREDVSEQSVYDFTKLFYENNEFLLSQNAIFSGSQPENALTGMCVPLHPGAEKYLKEIGAI